MDFTQLNYYLHEGFVRPLLYLIDPSRRIFIIYLLSAFLIGVVLFKLQGYSIKEAINNVFRKDHWINKSARTDYILFLLCALVKAICIIPILAFSSTLAYILSDYATQLIDTPQWTMSMNTVLWLYPITLFLFKDLFVYIAHYLLHRNPYLWEFHKVHHSATSMTPITLYRMHPIEMIIQNLQGMLAFSVTTAIFYYFNHTILAKATILGVNAFSFVFFMAGANLRHSHVPFRYPKWMEHIFMSPYQHQMHHDSQAKFCHSNFGSRLAIWDTIFGTLHTSNELPPKEIKFGLPDKLYGKNNAIGNVCSPFIGCYKRVKSNILHHSDG